MKTKESLCVQGSVVQKQILCNESPFALINGHITFNGLSCLIRTKSFFGCTKQVPWESELAEPIIKALNMAYKAGYEKDRFEWVLQ